MVLEEGRRCCAATKAPTGVPPHRALLDILTRTAYLLGWHRYFGPASGSDPKIRDAMARYVLTVHELSLAQNKHTTATKIDKACPVVINAFNQWDVARMWGAGKVAAADGSRIETWEDNLLAVTTPARTACTGHFTNWSG